MMYKSKWTKQIMFVSGECVFVHDIDHPAFEMEANPNG